MPESVVIDLGQLPDWIAALAAVAFLVLAIIGALVARNEFTLRTFSAMLKEISDEDARFDRGLIREKIASGADVDTVRKLVETVRANREDEDALIGAAAERTIARLDRVGFFLIGNKKKLKMEPPVWFWTLTSQIWSRLGKWVEYRQTTKDAEFQYEGYGYYFGQLVKLDTQRTYGNDKIKSNGETEAQTFNPIALGLAFFGFSTALWGTEMLYRPTWIMGWVCIALSFCLGIAVLTMPLTRWFRKHVRPRLALVVPTIFILYLFGNLVSWLGGLSQFTGSEHWAFFIVGFGWVFIFLMIQSSQARKISRKPGIVVAVFLVIFAVVQLFTVGWIPAVVLLAFSTGIYLITRDRWHIFDKFSLLS